MKNFVILVPFILLSVIIINCNDEDNITNGVTLPINTINGVIENWHSGRMNLKATVYYHEEGGTMHYLQTIDSTFINADNSFTINLSSPIINTSDSFYFPNYGDCVNGINISPANSKFKFLTLDIYNQNDTAIGYILKSDADTNIEHENAESYLYTSTNSSINGIRICSTHYSNNLIINSDYSWSALRGWNRIFINLFQQDSTHFTEKYTMSTSANLRWRYRQYIIFDNQSNVKKTGKD